jgi:hypothetical protein
MRFNLIDYVTILSIDCILSLRFNSRYCGTQLNYGFYSVINETIVFKVLRELTYMFMSISYKSMNNIAKFPANNRM